MSTGYSKTPLVKKLGIKAGFRLCILNESEDYSTTLGNLPPNIERVNELAEDLDFVQFFARNQAELADNFAKLKASIKFDGMLWISWIKKSAKIPTDLTEDIIRDIGLDCGLVDVKVCAVDEIWSGLKFVYRKEDRP